MTPERFKNIFNMTREEYLNAFPELNYQVKNQQGEDKAIIDIQGYIGRDVIREWITGEKSPNTVENLKETLRDISASTIIVNINSYGGDLNAGIVIKDMMQSKKARVVTNMQGFSASAATVIAYAGTVRRMPETAFMLPHRAMIGMLGYYNQNTFRSLTKDLEAIDSSLIKMYAARASISEQEISDLMDEGEGYGRWVPADEALEMGLIDEVYDPADEEDPDTDHLEGEVEDEEQAMMNKESLKKFAAFHTNSALLQMQEGPDDEESSAAEARRQTEVSNVIFKQIHEV